MTTTERIIQDITTEMTGIVAAALCTSTVTDDGTYVRLTAEIVKGHIYVTAEYYADQSPTYEMILRPTQAAPAPEEPARAGDRERAPSNGIGEMDEPSGEST